MSYVFGKTFVDFDDKCEAISMLSNRRVLYFSGVIRCLEIPMAFFIMLGKYPILS